EASGSAALDVVGILLLIVGIAALQLFLQRGVSQSWQHSPEIVAEVSIAFAALALLGLHASRAGFSVFRPDVFSDINFAVAAFFRLSLAARSSRSALACCTHRTARSPLSPCRPTAAPTRPGFTVCCASSVMPLGSR